MTRPLHLPDITYLPTDVAVLEPLVAVLEDLNITPQKVIDLGSGDGRVLNWFFEQYDCECVGYEIDETRATEANNLYPNVTTNNTDLWDATDVATADVIFLYWMPYLMSGFIEAFWDTLPTGTVVVSHAFQLPGITPLAQRELLFIYQK